MSLVRVATCNLNQWSMSLDYNLENIVQSILQAKTEGARFRTGPELEVSGYGCQDHFLEQDLFAQCLQSIERLLLDPRLHGIICDVGLPMLHRSAPYNCRLFFLDGQILFIRPKLVMCDDGNYRETRYFAPWTRVYDLDDHVLPVDLQRATGQRSVPFGNAILETNNGSIGVETCEELFSPDSPHIALSACGADILANGSGSHHTLRKLDRRLALIRGATSKAGGVYLYANQQGCDGGRLYFDGCASVCVNGNMVAQGSQFSLKDVEVVTATVNLQAVQSYRACVSSRNLQASTAKQLPRVQVDFDIACLPHLEATLPIMPKTLLMEEEIAMGPACWLWDYLRRSGASGYFVPLSGGADSGSTAAIVGSMCQLVFKALGEGDEQVTRDVQRMVGEGQPLPASAAEFAGAIFHTCYMGTVNSTSATRDRAKRLAGEIGSYHSDTNIDAMTTAVLTVFTGLFGKTPHFRSNTTRAGTWAENLALQNIQARSRMVLGYLMAQLLPWVRGKSGFLLVLGSANVDEALTGYATKYDCSSADINPIGGIAKEDLKKFLLWGADNLGYGTLQEIAEARPTAELEPITADYEQSDEADMGITYKELGEFGRLRKLQRCGPVAMFQILRHRWRDSVLGAEVEGTIEEKDAAVAAKVKKFFVRYSRNRHKATVFTPSYHAEDYSPDDNRFDHRQFLYDTKWERQFAEIDRLVAGPRVAASTATKTRSKKRTKQRSKKTTGRK